MKFALSAAIAGLVATLAATNAAAVETQTTPAAIPAPAAAAEPVPTTCAAFPARPTLPEALTVQNAPATIDAANAYLDAVEAGNACRVKGSNALNARSNDLAAYANYSIKAARAAADGQAPAEAAPAAPASECEDYPALATMPPATDVPGRNTWVGSVNTAHQCRLAEVRSLREQAAALSASDNREAVMSDALAMRAAVSSQVEALNAAEAAKAAKGNKKKKNTR